MARNGISRLYSSSQSDTVHTWKGHWQLLIRSSEDINKDLNTRDIAFPSKPKTLSRILTSCLNVLVLGLSGKKKNLGFAGVSTGYLLSSWRLAFQCKQTEQWTGNRRRLSNYQRRQKSPLRFRASVEWQAAEAHGLLTQFHQTQNSDQAGESRSKSSKVVSLW